MAHGALDDPQEYTLTGHQAVRQLELLATQSAGARVLVLGHTHLARAWDRAAAALMQVSEDAVRLPQQGPCLLNPGAVGQSRERLARARFMLLDLAKSQATFYAVPYDIERCRRELRKVGLSPRSPPLRPSALDRALPPTRPRGRFG